METKAGKQYDLTQGSILQKLLMVSLPLMGTQLIQMTYNLTDMFWLGRLSSDAVAASGTAGMYIWMSVAFLMVGRMGAEIGVSQCLGRGDRPKAQAYAQMTILIGFVLGVFYTLAMVLLRTPLIGFFHIREGWVARDAANYLAAANAATSFAFVSGVVAGIFNGAGNPRIPFFINLAGLAVNMILDPICIFHWKMGIVGAGVATSFAQTVVCVLSLVALKKSKTRPFERFRFRATPQRELIRQIIRWSTPVALESLFFTFLAMFISRFVTAWGADAIAGQRVGVQIESLSWLIGGGFATALTAFVGQNYGAGKWSRIHKGFRVSLITIVAWGVFTALLMFFGARMLFMIILPDEAIVGIGISYLRILSTCQVFSSLEFVSAGAFRGTGKTLPPSLVSITANALRVPLAYVLSRGALGLDGIWWGLAIGCTGRGLWLFVWYIVQSRKQPQEDLPQPA